MLDEQERRFWGPVLRIVRVTNVSCIRHRVFGESETIVHVVIGAVLGKDRMRLFPLV